MFYTKFLEYNLNYLDKEDFAIIFNFLIEKCCKEENPILMEESQDVGVKILHAYSAKYSGEIISIFDH